MRNVACSVYSTPSAMTFSLRLCAMAMIASTGDNVAVHVAYLPAPQAVLRASETVRLRLDAFPGQQGT